MCSSFVCISFAVLLNCDVNRTKISDLDSYSVIRERGGVH